MTWDIDEFIRETEAIFLNETHSKYIETKLPNKGDALDDICNRGLKQLDRNGENLCRGLIEGSSIFMTCMILKLI